MISFKNEKQPIYYWLLFLFSFSIPISSWISVKLLLVGFILSLFAPSSIGNLIKRSWTFLFYIAVLLVGLVYSSNRVSGIDTLETSFSFFAIPFLFSRVNTNCKEVADRLLLSFVLGLLLSSLLCLTFAIFKYLQSENQEFLFYYDLTNLLGFQPTYYAYYLIFGITYCLHSLYYGEGAYSKRVILSVVTFFYFMLVLTAGRTTFVALLLVISFFILKYIVEETTKEKLYALPVIIFMLAGLFFVNFFGWTRGDSLINDSWERMIFWELAIDAIPNLFFGVGTGDYQDALNQSYLNRGLIDFAKGDFNSHNQPIQLLLSNGIFGFVAFFAMIFHPLYLAYRTRNMFCTLAVFPFFIYGITEVFLGRYQGVIFFAWLHQILIFWMLADRAIISQIQK